MQILFGITPAHSDGNSFRKTPEKIFQDLLFIYKQYKKIPEEIIFSDESLSCNFVYNFSKILIQKKFTNFNFRAFLDIKSGFHLKALKIAQRVGFGKTGRGRLSISMETSSPRLNKIVNKNFTVQEAKRTIEFCLKLNLNIQINFISLLPTQTKKRIYL